MNQLSDPVQTRFGYHLIEVTDRRKRDISQDLARNQAYSAVWNQEFNDAYREVRCPLHILCATDDVLYPFFSRAREIRPDAVAVELPAGSNFEPDLDPDGIAEALRSFLDSVAAASGG